MRYATLGTGGDGHHTGDRQRGRRARSLVVDHVGRGQGGDEGLIARVVLGMLEGGIVFVRSFRTTFSQTSALLPGFARSGSSSLKPAVCRRWLWQVTQ